MTYIMTNVQCGSAVQASVPIPKFANTGGTLSCKLRNQRDTSKSMILVPLLNPKFAIGLPARLCELRVRGTGSVYHARQIEVCGASAPQFGLMMVDDQLSRCDS